MDFAVYSGGVYVFTEAYYYVLGPAKETNIAVVWCLLTVAFSVYPSSGCPAAQGGGRQVGAGLELSFIPCPQIGISAIVCCPTKLPKTGWCKMVTILFALLLGSAQPSRPISA